MGFFSQMKANMDATKAYKLHSNGQLTEARGLYASALEAGGGIMNPRYMLSYAVLLIRLGEYQQARELLTKTQHIPGILPEQKSQLFMNYAACVYKMGEIDKGITILERQHAKQPAGNIYETLGYLYIEKLENKPDPSEPAPVPEAPEAPAENAEGEAEAEAMPAEPLPTPYEQWEQLRDKALAFCEEAIDYDDEDAICLDNMGQLYYRILGDKETAKTWFDKAHAVKPGQIDTLWFLSRYDLEKGDTAAAIEKLQKMVDGRYSVLNYVSKEQTIAELERLGGKYSGTKA